MSNAAHSFRFEHTLSDLREGLELVHPEVERALDQCGYEDGAKFAIRLAVEEAIVNAFRHGNQLDPSKVVRFRASIDAREVVLEVEDQGPGFDPAAIPDPTEDENLEIPSGRGVMLIRAYMSEVEYLPPGNRVRMVFRKPIAA